ncbi:hypothetical protein ADK38_24645, partial [Streptomyces varsoviensis]
PADAVALLGLARAARAAMSDAELDAMPPRAQTVAHDGSEDRTSVLPRSIEARAARAADDASYARTTRLE